MALLLEKENNYGGTTSYWKIVDLNINYLTNISHIVMCGWTDKTARDTGKQPTDQRIYDFSGDTFPFIDIEPQNEREIAYTTIKAMTTTIPATTPEETDTIVPGEFSEAENI